MAEPKFEKDLERLEELVEALEEGGLSLDDSLKKFEEGIKLAQRCEKALSAAEKRIEILTRTAKGELKAEPFEEDPCETIAEDSGANSETLNKPDSGDKAAPSGDEDEDDDELLF